MDILHLLLSPQHPVNTPWALGSVFCHACHSTLVALRSDTACITTLIGQCTESENMKAKIFPLLRVLLTKTSAVGRDGKPSIASRSAHQLCDKTRLTVSQRQTKPKTLVEGSLALGPVN